MLTASSRVAPSVVVPADHANLAVVWAAGADRPRSQPDAARALGLGKFLRLAGVVAEAEGRVRPGGAWHGLRCRRPSRTCSVLVPPAGAGASGLPGHRSGAHATYAMVTDAMRTSLARRQRKGRNGSGRGSTGASNIARIAIALPIFCLLYTSPSPRDRTRSRMPS